jgi:hypothetical protein
MNNTISNLVKFIAGAVIVLGLTSNVVRAQSVNGCVTNVPGTFSSSIGSTTTCADHNMSGCVVAAGGTTCNYAGSSCNFQVTVNPAVGQSGDKSTTFSVSGTCQAKRAIAQGNQGANYCSYLYPGGVTGDTVSTLGSKGTAVSHKQLEVCTDEIAVTTPPPVISLEKKVVRIIDGVFDCDDATDEINGIAPFDVSYCYTIRNDGQGTINNLVIVDDNGTPDDDLDDFTVQGQLTLAGGSPPLVLNSVDHLVIGTPALLTKAGELVNTATVSGTFEGDECPTCTNIDAATVNVAVVCDADTQAEADATGTVVERRGLEGDTRCAPRTDSVTEGVGLLCDGTCELKPECIATGSGQTLPASCVQPCRPSGNWNTYGENGVCIANASASPGNLPLCQEVLTNPSNSSDCTNDVTNPSLIRSDGHSSAYRRNPLLYYFPSSGGGNSVGTIYCILYPGDTSSDCPAGSIIY